MLCITIMKAKLKFRIQNNYSGIFNFHKGQTWINVNSKFLSLIQTRNLYISQYVEHTKICMFLNIFIVQKRVLCFSMWLLYRKMYVSQYVYCAETRTYVSQCVYCAERCMFLNVFTVKKNICFSICLLYWNIFPFTRNKCETFVMET